MQGDTNNNSRNLAITHRVGIKAPIVKVYKALSTLEGISGWWTEQTSGTSEVGKVIVLRFLTLEGKEVGSMRIEVKDLVPEKKVHWKFNDGPSEWIDTEVVFDLREEEGFTIVLFAHRNWKEEVEFMGHCSMKWAVFMLSLKLFVENGKGNPSPNDVKIDNWN